MLFINTEIKSYILTQSMLAQVVEKYQPSNEYVSFPILLPETDKSEQFQFLVTDNQNIQELLDDHSDVLAELLLKIEQHRYDSKLGVAKYKAIVFVTLESLVYRPD